MKKLLILLLVIAGCTKQNDDVRKILSLAGEWKFRIDSLDEGIKNQWFNDLATETVKLPGSMAENGKGNEVTLKTDWTGEIVDRSYFTDKKYERYRKPGNIKIPFWLKPVKYYKGVAWYQKEVDVPDNWKDKDISLFLERPHWESTVFINGKKAGTANSLSVPHQYDLTDLLATGKNLISIRIDNRVVVPVGINSHSISDHTQSNWNGIAGDLSLRATSKVYIRNIKVYPDIKGRKAKVIVDIVNKTKSTFKGKVIVKAESFNSHLPGKLKSVSVNADTGSENLQLVIDYPMGDDMQLWSEFRPSLYKLIAGLKDFRGEIIDSDSTQFGMREFKTISTRFEVNNRQVFLRGTLECCIFPLTGYPPTDVSSWLRVLQTMKDYGLNTVRFHSWCPPEAAFIAGDKLGMYFQIECSSWVEPQSVMEESSISLYMMKVTE